MNKRSALITVVSIFLMISVYAQRRTSSPYSFYGIGSLKFKGSVESRSMGGLSIYSDSIHINFRNPASYVGHDLEFFGNKSRPVKFTVAGSRDETLLKGKAGKDNVSTTSFDYIGLAFPISPKFGMGFGLVPYTAIGYQIESTDDQGFLTSRFEGEGGVNKVYFSLGYKVTNSLSIGATVNYNFGDIKSSNTQVLYDQKGDLLQYSTREDNDSDLSGLNVDFGVSYTRMITDKLQLMSGATFSPKSNITSQNSRILNAITISATGQEAVVNSINENENLKAAGLLKTDLTLPAQFSIGAGIGEPRKWFAGLEYQFQNTSEFANPFFSTAATTYNNASRVSLGGFYIPEYDSFSGFFKRLVYRAGFRYEDTGLVLREESIDEFGISFGIGLPVGRVFSNINLGFEYGQRGTTKKGLIKEDFFSFQISISLNDIWFQKTKIN